MHNRVFAAAIALSFVATPFVGQAQVVNGAANGAAQGANEGAAAGGPVGGIVGGAVGAGIGAATGAVGTAAGIVGGVLGADQRPRFREFVVREHHPSVRFGKPLRVGVVLPRAGVTYYEVPPEYRVRPGYRYTVIDEHPVLVDPTTRRVVEVIE